MSTWANVSYNYRGAQVLVTGGTSGIGAGIAAAYRDAGAEVTITGTRKAAGGVPRGPRAASATCS